MWLWWVLKIIQLSCTELLSDGCDRPDLFPKNINGWFWSATQVAMPPTNSTRSFHDWSHTGGLGVPQPDNREETQLHGESESCMAVLNNYYGDGEEQGDLVTVTNYYDVSSTKPSPALLSLPLIQPSLSCRHQVARRGLYPREAHHLRGRGWSPGLRQAAFPPDQNTLRTGGLNDLPSANQ